MHLKPAVESDSSRLIEYFKTSILPGHLHLKIERHPPFFAHYRLQSDDHVTYILEHGDHNIVAMATMIFRQGWIEGEQQTIGYATDLRVSPSRKATLLWSRQFLPAMEREMQKRNCRYVFSVLAKQHRQAHNALIRPRKMRRILPRYQLFNRFHLVSLHGLFPFAKSPIETVEVRHATENDIDALSAFVVKKNITKPIHYFRDQEGFLNQLKRWPGSSIENFVIALDRRDNIVGCTMPWSMSHTQTIVPVNYSAKALTFFEALQVASIFGLAHRLPKKNFPLNPISLNYLNSENPDVFYAILRAIYAELKNDEFLVYPHFEGHLMHRPPPSFIHGSQRCGFYCLLPSNAEPPDFLRPATLRQPPEFEVPFW